MNELEIHFFTIVINGMPFIEQHIKTFKNLSIQWHWHIIEGVADLKNDTAWSVPNGGKIPKSLHSNGQSIDGTSAYIDQLKVLYPNQISIYRKPPGMFWNGKAEMVNAPLQFIKKEVILWQIDVDEFWTCEQIAVGHQMFKQDPSKYAAFYWCHYFVGPTLMLLSRHCYANNPNFEWLRTWRYKPGFRFLSHEPPTLAEQSYSGTIKPVTLRGTFSHEETESKGLIFQHFAYTVKSQLEFKESYYGYRDAVLNWERLQSHTHFPAKLKEFFTWVNDETIVGTAESIGIEPLISFAKN